MVIANLEWDLLVHDRSNVIDSYSSSAGSENQAKLQAEISNNHILLILVREGDQCINPRTHLISDLLFCQFDAYRSEVS